uniref:Uncharacterized protein n=1 Tax=viral metagenome TaxID=1070528 RepID=A0A6C0K2P9_9ZZZZ
MPKTRKASRKAPAESATLFPLETVKTGLDGQEWIVLLKGRAQRWVPHKKEAVLFVTYKMGTGGSWAYKLPKGWEWIGSGGTTSAAYPNEEQFQGTPATTATVKAYLTKFFADLKKKGIVEQFKLKSSL